MALWKSIVLTLLAAGLQILIFPNFGFSFLAWIMLIPLLAVFGSRGVGASFLLGGLFGLLMALGITSWLYYSVVHYFGAAWHIGLALVVGACLFYEALFTGLFGVLVSFTRPLARGAAGILLVPCFWVTCEILRANWLSENAWGLLGYSQYKHLPLIQIADLSGVYGISFVVVMVNVALYHGIRQMILKKTDPEAPAWTVRDWGTTAGIPALILCAVLGYGFLRMDRYETLSQGEPKIRTVAIQGNIKRDYRWKSIYYGKNLTKYLKMSRRPENLEADLLVWPENALNFHPDRETLFLNLIRNTVANPARPLLTGAPHMETGPGTGKRFFNSAYLITADGIQDRYDKIHLMPFSERKPAWMKKYFGAPGEAPASFFPGEEYTVFSLPGFSFAAPVCFEMVYPELIRKFPLNGAQFLVNISNDSWFGPSAGPYQHLIFSTFRAVENRRFVVRAANTGISALVSPTGEILEQTALNEDAVLSGDVVPLDEQTFYTRRGDLFAILCSLATLLSVLYCLLRPRLTYPRYLTTRHR
jgi:apolipoprotein N-acyltransferase